MGLYVIGLYLRDVLRHFAQCRADRQREATASRNLRELTRVVDLCRARGIEPDVPFDLLTGRETVECEVPQRSFTDRLIDDAPYYINQSKELLNCKTA